MAILEIKGLAKHYPHFSLDHVSFSLDEGYIMGFIGRNGSGKSTTLKSLYRLVKKDEGEIILLDKKLEDYNEKELKQNVSLMLGGVDFYSNTRIGRITEATRPFYENWDEETYQKLIHKFSLLEDKKFKELSNGMKTKYLLTLAMSHHARLLILDEPTSGLDPFSRDEILTTFQEFIVSGERSVLFSTQIVSDLEQIADYITYIKAGKIVKSLEKEAFCHNYRYFRIRPDEAKSIPSSIILGHKETKAVYEGLIQSKDENRLPSDAVVFVPNIEQVMIMIERGNDYESVTL